MIVAVGQFAVTADWHENARLCVELMAQSARQGAALLVLPEALLARDDNDPDLSVKSAQPLDGGFLTLLLAESKSNRLTTILTVHVPTIQGRAETRLSFCVKGKSLRTMQNSISTMRSTFRNPGWLTPGIKFRR